MTCRSVVANDLEFNYCPEDPIVAADRMRLVMGARMVDELTGLPMSSSLRVLHAHSGLQVRAAGGGLTGLVGNPKRLFPNLAAAAVNLQMTITAERFLPRRLSADIGPLAGFPNIFQALDFGDVFMHRAATRLRGRVAQNNGVGRQPLAGADVEILGVWPSSPPSDVDPVVAMQPASLVALTPGLYAERSVAADSLRQQPMLLAAGEEKTLLAPAVGGQNTLFISDQINLAVGDILAIQASHADLVEYITISAINGASSTDQPAIIELTYPLTHYHPAGISVVKATPQLAGNNNSINRAGIPGDRSCFIDSMTNLNDGDVVEISGTGTVEYQTIHFYQTVTDADGYFRLPPLARVARIRLQADRADLLQPQLLDFSPDYDFAEQRLDIVI